MISVPIIEPRDHGYEDRSRNRVTHDARSRSTCQSFAISSQRIRNLFAMHRGAVTRLLT